MSIEVTFSSKKVVSILRSNYPELRFTWDEAKELYEKLKLHFNQDVDSEKPKKIIGPRW